MSCAASSERLGAGQPAVLSSPVGLCARRCAAILTCPGRECSPGDINVYSFVSRRPWESFAAPPWESREYDPRLILAIKLSLSLRSVKLMIVKFKFKFNDA